MIQDKVLEMAVNEALPNGGAPLETGALGGTSVTGSATTPFIYDLSSGNGAGPFQFIHDAIGSGELELVVDIETSFSAAQTLGNALVEFQLVSLPWNPLNLNNAATQGKLLEQSGITGDAVTDVITLAGPAFHDIPVGTPIYFRTLTGGTGLVANSLYYVVGVGANTVVLANTTDGAYQVYRLTGAPINFTTNITAGVMVAQPFVHATTGPISAAMLKGGAKLVARTSPFCGTAPGRVVPHYINGVSIPMGSAIPSSTSTGGGGNTYGVPTPGRYLCILAKVLQGTAGTVGRYSARVVLTGGQVNSHFPTRFEVF